MTQSLTTAQTENVQPSYADFKAMLKSKQANPNYRGFIRFENTNEGIKLAKVSKHWYSEWAINFRTNVDAEHNKQMREKFVNSMRMDYLDEGVKGKLRSVLYKNGVEADGNNLDALKRMEIKDISEIYENAWNSDRRHILHIVAQQCLGETYLTLPWDGNRNDSFAEIEKFIRENVKQPSPSELLLQISKMCLNPDKVQEGAVDMAGFQAFVDTFKETLTKAVNRLDVKNTLHNVLQSVLTTDTVNGFDQGKKILSDDQKQIVRESLLAFMKNEHPGFDENICLTKNVGDTLNIMTMFMDQVLPILLKKKMENCLEYKKMTPEQLSFFGQDVTWQSLCEDELKPEDIIRMAEHYFAGLTEELSKDKSELSVFTEKLTGDLGDLLKNAQNNSENREQMLDQRDNVNLANMGLNIRGMAIETVYYSGTDWNEMKKLMGNVEQDLKKGGESAEKKVRAYYFTQRFLSEDVGVPQIPDGKNAKKKVFTEIEKRALEINAALQAQYGTVTVTRTQAGKLKRTKDNGGVSDLHKIIYENLELCTQNGTNNQPPLFDKNILDKLYSFALPAYLKSCFDDFDSKKEKATLDNNQLHLKPQEVFTSLMTTYESYKTALEDFNESRQGFITRFLAICNKNIARGHLTEDEKGEFANSLMQKLRDIEEQVSKEFFDHAPMKVNDGYAFVGKRFTQELQKYERTLYSELLAKIVKTCDTMDPHDVALGGTGVNHKLKNELMNSKGVVEQFMTRYLDSHQQKIGKDIAFISSDGKKQKLEYALLNAYNKFLLNRLSNKRLFESRTVVITPKFIASVKADFVKHADKLMKKYVTFEANMEKAFNSCLEKQWNSLMSNEKLANHYGWNNLNNEEKKQVIASLNNATVNALNTACGEFLDDFFSNPDGFTENADDVFTQVEENVFVVNDNFAKSVLPILNEQVTTVHQGMGGNVDQFISNQERKFAEPYENVVMMNSVMLSGNEDQPGQVMMETNDREVKMLEGNKTLQDLELSFSKLDDSKKNSYKLYQNVDKSLVDKETFELLNQPVVVHNKEVNDNRVKQMVSWCVNKVISDAIAKPLLYGIGTSAKCNERIQKEIRDLISSEVKKMNAYIKDYMAMAKSVLDKKENVGLQSLGRTAWKNIWNTCGENIGVHYDIPDDKSKSIQPQDFPSLTETGEEAKLTKGLQEQLKTLSDLKEKRAKELSEKFTETYIREVKQIDRGVELYFDPELEKKYDSELFDYINQTALRKFKDTCQKEISNNLKFFSSEERAQQTSNDWMMIAERFVTHLQENLNNMRLVNTKSISEFLSTLSDADGMNHLKELAKEIEIKEDLPPAEKEKLQKREENRKQMLRMIARNLKTWNKNPNILAEYYSMQKDKIDKYCQEYTDAVIKKAQNLTLANHDDDVNIKLELDLTSIEFYKSFKEDILKGISGMALTSNFNEFMVPAARDAFARWMHDEGLDNMKIKDQLMERFNQRIKSLLDRMSKGENVKEPVFTIAFVDDLMALVDSQGLAEKVDTWKQEHLEKYEKEFLDSFGQQIYSNQHIVMESPDNAFQQRMAKVQADNIAYLRSSLNSVLDTVNNQYAHRLRFFQSFGGIRQQMEKRADELVSSHMQSYMKKSKLRYDFEFEHQLKMDINREYRLFIKNIQVMFVGDSFKEIQTLTENDTPREIADKLSWCFTRMQEKNEVSKKTRAQYKAIEDFFGVMERFVTKIYDRLHDKLMSFTGTDDYAKVRSHVQMWFFEATGLLDVKNPDKESIWFNTIVEEMKQNLTLVTRDTARYNYFKDIFGEAKLSAEDQKVVEKIKTVWRDFMWEVQDIDNKNKEALLKEKRAKK